MLTHPGEERERRTDQHHRPTRRVNRAQLETIARIPDQVPDASAEVQEKGKRTAKQQDPADPGTYEDVYRRVGLWSGRRRNQPNHQHDGIQAQNDASDPIRNR